MRACIRMGFVVLAGTGFSRAVEPRLLIYSGQPEGVYRHEAIAWFRSMAYFTAATWSIKKEELVFFLKDPTPSWKPNPALAKVTVLLTFPDTPCGPLPVRRRCGPDRRPVPRP